jgi:hypothetical protein
LYLIPALRNKNTHLTPPIPVIAVQPASLLTDCGRKQTRVPNLAWLVGSLPASNATVHLRLQRITDGYTGAVSRRRSLSYGLRVLLPVLNIRAALAGYLPSLCNVDCTERDSLKGDEYQLWLQNQQSLYRAGNLVIAPDHHLEVGVEKSSLIAQG